MIDISLKCYNVAPVDLVDFVTYGHMGMPSFAVYICIQRTPLGD